MKEDWESPKTWYKIIDEIGNNCIFGFIYTNYIRTLRLQGDENLLDFGSGSGAGSKHLAKLLQKRGGYLTCVDTSRYWTAKAQRRMRRYSNVSFYTNPITDLQLPPESFDVIYIFYALHDVSEELRDGIVNEFFRLLKPNGSLFIKEPQRADDGMPVSEIRQLMSSNGFIEKLGEEKSGAFSGVYKKQ